MNTYADKTQENKSQSVLSNHSQVQSGGESTFQVIDNRPEAVTQRKLQEMANNSPKTMQLKAFQGMANNSSPDRQADQLLAIADNSAEQQQPIQKKENNPGVIQLGKKKQAIKNVKKSNNKRVQHHVRAEYQWKNERKMELIEGGMNRKEAERQAAQEDRERKRNG